MSIISRSVFGTTWHAVTVDRKAVHEGHLLMQLRVKSLHAGEVGGGTAAEAKGDQANELQRAAGQASGREGAQIPDKMQDIGQASGEGRLLALPS